MKYIRALAFAGLLIVTGCSGSTSDVTGRVLEVEGNLENVTGFTLVTDDGDRLVFVTPLEADRIEFPLIHLRDHVLSAEPVVVVYETTGGTLVAIRIDDVPPS